MIFHLIKLVWNRKKTNTLIMLEVLCSFLVVFALAAVGINLLELYRRPLGFDYRDVWTVSVARGTLAYAAWGAEDAATFRRLLAELESIPQVVSAAAGTTAPFAGITTVWGWEYEGRSIEPEGAAISEDYPEVLGIELVQGRWFGEEDSALGWEPVVIDRELATLLYGDGDPIGKRVSDDERVDRRVIGVVDEFRCGGEFDEPAPFFFMPAREQTDDGPSLTTLLIKVAPGTRADFEEQLIGRLQTIAKEWTFTTRTLEAARRSALQEKLVPLLIASLVGGFLLIMVVLGLIGVMWQNVTRRTREIGLRRAAGASRASIHRQIVGEVMITAAFGVAAGAVLAVQVPFIGQFTFVPFDVVLVALLVSAALMLGLAALCGLYPGWTATRIHPAEALHYE